MQRYNVRPEGPGGPVRGPPRPPLWPKRSGEKPARTGSALNRLSSQLPQRRVSCRRQQRSCICCTTGTTPQPFGQLPLHRGACKLGCCPTGSNFTKGAFIAGRCQPTPYSKISSAISTIRSIASATIRGRRAFFTGSPMSSITMHKALRVA